MDLSAFSFWMIGTAHLTFRAIQLRLKLGSGVQSDLNIIVEFLNQSPEIVGTLVIVFEWENS